MTKFTHDDAARLSELTRLDEDGAGLTAEDYAELEDLLWRENAYFIEQHSEEAA